MAGSLGELFVSLGFEVDDKTLKDFHSEIKDTMNSVLKFAGITASAAGFTHLLNGAADTATELQNLSVQFGLNTQSVQGWAAALQQSNPLITMEQGLQSAQKIAEYIRDMQLGKGGNELGQFGGGPEDNTFEKVITRLRNNYDRVVAERGIPQTTAWIQAITGTSGTVNVLKESLADYNKEAEKGIVSQTDIDNLAKYNNSISSLSNTLEKLKLNLAAPVANGIVDLLGNINKLGWLQGFGQSLDDLGAANPFGLGRKEGLFYSDTLGVKDTAAAPSSAGGTTGKSAAEGYLQSVGWSTEQARGIVAGLIAESSLNPQAFNPAGGGHGAAGIAQWRGSRQQDLESFLGHSWKTATQQEELAFVNYELTKGNYRAAGARIKQQTSAAGAQGILHDDYEKPGDTTSTVYMTNHFTGNDQQAHAETIADQLRTTRIQQGLGPAR